MSTSENQVIESTSRTQFGIAAIFWTTFIVGLALTYLQRLDSVSVVLHACLAILIGLLVGAVVGALTKTLADAIFWATLIAAFGYLSTASDPRYAPLHCLAWAALGALSGALASSVFTQRPFLNALVSALAAGILMGVFYLVFHQKIRSADLTFDLYGAPVIGLAVAIFVQLIQWLENQRRMPRYVTATWLLVAVIAGNLISR